MTETPAPTNPAPSGTAPATATPMPTAVPPPAATAPTPEGTAAAAPLAAPPAPRAPVTFTAIPAPAPSPVLPPPTAQATLPIEPAPAPAPAPTQGAPAPASNPPPVPLPVPVATKTRPARPAKAPPLGRRPWSAAVGAAPTEPVTALHWALLAGIALLAIGMRLAEPLSSPLIGAEDPYRHMERTWDLVQGNPDDGYPPGINYILAPFTLLGADGFYQVSRFLPVAFGAIMVVGMFALCRRYTHPTGALAASLMVALMPEAIRRTDLLFPTAIDLALIPIFLLLVLRGTEGSKKAALGAGALGLAFLVVHPWALALLVPPLVVLGLYVVWTQAPQRHRVPVTAGVIASAVVAIFMAQLGSVPSMLKDHALPKVGELAANPGSLADLPPFVDFGDMLGATALILGAAGAVVAFRRFGRFSLLALAWTLLLLPLIVVDWFGLWYVPHRVVVYFGLGIAMLGALAVGELTRFVTSAKPKSQAAATVGALAVIGFLMVPSAVAVDPWYRIYQEEDLDAWRDLDAMGVENVMTGSWQSRAGYRAATGNDALYNPGFFDDPVVREYESQKDADLVVIVDQYTRDAGLPTEFLENGRDWELIGSWGTTQAYQRA